VSREAVLPDDIEGLSGVEDRQVLSEDRTLRHAESD